MYYNIKIKSNGSEFSLETNNKEVLAREMDLYFACIFDVSDDFKSKIKKVEITDKNVKSIEEFEAPQKIQKEIEKLDDARIQELAKLKAQEIIKAHQEKLEQEKKQIKENLIQEEATQPLSISPINTEQINQPTQIIKFQNIPIATEIPEIQIITDAPINEAPISEAPITQASENELPAEIMELINLAQKKIEAIEKSPNENSSPSDKNLAENTQEEKLSTTEKNNITKLNDIFNTPTPKIPAEELDENPIVQTPQTTENLYTDSVEVSLTDIEISLEEQKEELSEENSPEKEITETEETNKNLAQEEITKEKISITPVSQAASQMDFKPFLSGFGCNELPDEFLVCAYYIKNVLKQSDFTMKFINSKLFQATGKIADMSIIDELTTKEYIRIIDTEDGKKYSITMDGEAYFASKFQG